MPASRSVLTKTPGEAREGRSPLRLSTISGKKMNLDLGEQPKASMPPPWDRIHDVEFHKHICENERDASSRADKFSRSVSLLYARSNREQKPTDCEVRDNSRKLGRSQLFQLPMAVRLQIYRHILGTACAGTRSAGSRPIRMNSMVHNRLVWPDGAFCALADVLAPLQNILLVSFALRTELLAALFLERSFHVTFSPYVRPATSPLAVAFVNRYGCLMQRLTVELDCTRLGYGMDAAATGLAPGMLHVDGLVRDFVAGQTARAGYSTMDSLVVLCRRFHGNRPSVDDNAAMPYAGPECEKVAQQLTGLGDLVDSARIVGFSAAFAAGLIQSLQGGSTIASSTEQRQRQRQPQPQPQLQSAHIWRRTPSDAYTLLPGQRAYLDYGPRIGVQLSPMISFPPTPPPSLETMSVSASLLPSRRATDLDMSPASGRPSSPALSTPSKRTSFVGSLLERGFLEGKLAAGITNGGLYSVVVAKPKKLQKRRPTGVV